MMKKDTLHLYKRVSTDQQEIEGHSLEYQEDLGIKKSQENIRCELDRVDSLDYFLSEEEVNKKY